MFCLILGLIGMVVAHQQDEGGYYTYWKPESYADHHPQPQEKQVLASYKKTHPLANAISGYFHRVQNRQSTRGVSLVSKIRRFSKKVERGFSM